MEVYFMTIHSPIVTVLLIILAVIGAIALLVLLGMLFMHDSMMGVMGSKMMAACRSMMAAPS
jgi:hypothetical protein